MTDRFEEYVGVVRLHRLGMSMVVVWWGVDVVCHKCFVDDD